MLDKAYRTKREEMLNILRENDIGEDRFMDFDTPDPETNFNLDKINQDQFKELQKIIQRTKPLKLSSIEEKHEMLRVRAEELAKKKTKKETIEVDVNKIKIHEHQRKQSVPVPVYSVGSKSSKLGASLGKTVGGMIGGFALGVKGLDSIKKYQTQSR